MSDGKQNSVEEVLLGTISMTDPRVYLKLPHDAEQVFPSAIQNGDANETITRMVFYSREQGGLSLFRSAERSVLTWFLPVGPRIDDL